MEGLQKACRRAGNSFPVHPGERRRSAAPGNAPSHATQGSRDDRSPCCCGALGAGAAGRRPVGDRSANRAWASHVHRGSFNARLRDTPHTWSEWTCSQLLQNTPLHPIAEWGRQRFGGADIPLSGGLRTLRIPLHWSSSIRRRTSRCWRRCWTFHCRRTASRLQRRNNCAAGNWAP